MGAPMVRDLAVFPLRVRLHRSAAAGLLAVLSASCTQGGHAVQEQGDRASTTATSAVDGDRAAAPDFDRPPYTAGVVVGKDYPYRLHTHCGIHGTRIDGRDWDADPPLDDGSGNPPPGWDENDQNGVIRLTSDDRAVFRAVNGLVARFKARSDRALPTECE